MGNPIKGGSIEKRDVDISVSSTNFNSIAK